MKEITYIDNNIENGIEYDWNYLLKLFKKLKIPKNIWNPSHIPFNNYTWFTLFSRRGTGKTSSFLIFLLLMNREYGTVGEYIRQTPEMLKPSKLQTLFEAIETFGYIEKITNKEYNGIYYYGKKFYLCKREGTEKKPDIIADKPFLVCHSIDEAYSMKSTYNNPLGDIIILDEFENKTYKENEWLDFHQIISTIRRLRINVKIILLGNTISPHCYYFREMGIDTEVSMMKPHEIRSVKTKRGTNIYIEYIEPLATKKEVEEHMKNVNMFHGWDNLNSITGEGWDLYDYPHITRDIRKDSTTIEKFYIDFNGMLFKGLLSYSPKYSYNVFIEPCNSIDNRHLTFVRGRELNGNNEVYGTGFNQHHKKLWYMWELKRMLFATNNIGDLIEQYYYCK